MLSWWIRAVVEAFERLHEDILGTMQDGESQARDQLGCQNPCAQLRTEPMKSAKDQGHPHRSI